ncbi:MAG: response regulator [bacterium]|nr:response regulator [bacterium]
MNRLKDKKQSSILIVDDDPKYLMLISKILENQDYLTVKVPGGKEALDMLMRQDFQPDVVLLDVLMPGIHGHEVCKRMKENPAAKDIPVIFLTAGNEVSDIIKGFELGAVDYIVKPFNHLELVARIDTQLKLKSKTRQLEQLNKRLESRVKEEVEKRRKQESLLIHRSKLVALGEMVGAIAHQWRQPLSTMAFIVENILDDLESGELDGDDLEKSLNKAAKQVTFMSKVIEDFMNFYKPSRAEGNFDVIHSVSETLSILDPELDRRSIKITPRFDAGSLVIKGHDNDFKQIVFNIVNNAKDAILESREKGLKGNSEGEIRITATRDDYHAVIIISDDGGGVPHPIREKIFQPFFSTKTDKKGSGIGLYLVRTIIEDHMNGSIGLDNTPDGAQFTIKLPLNRDT